MRSKCCNNRVIRKQVGFRQSVHVCCACGKECLTYFRLNFFRGIKKFFLELKRKRRTR